MRLSPTEIDKLLLHQAGVLAQKRLARGVRLNFPESVALIATQILEFIRDGRSVAELMDLGKRFLGHRNVMNGVPEMISEVQVEGTFRDGSKLVTVHHPIVFEFGDLTLALHGSFFPVPSNDRFSNEGLPGIPGAYDIRPGELELNAGRRTTSVYVTNMGDRPIQVGSHYPFAETNAALVFERERAKGMRLDIPAGTAVRFDPGERRNVQLVEYVASAVVDHAVLGRDS